MSTQSQYQTHAGDGDQRTYARTEMPPPDRHHEGQQHSHANLDGKDQKSLANKLDQASREEKQRRQADDYESHTSPTAPALFHGNEPSKGAKVDQELEQEDAEILRKKGIKP